jgi:hypothetical protein
MEKNSEEVKLRVPESLLLALSKLANAEDRSLSEYCRTVLASHAFGHVHRLDQARDAREGTNGPSQGPRN